MSAALHPRAPASLPVVRILGRPIHAVTEAEAVRHVLDELDAGRGGVVVTPNLDHLRRADADREFREIVDASDLVLADGMPLVWASRIAGRPLPERVAGSNVISSLSAAAAARGRSVFLLGGVGDAAAGAARLLCARSPSLRVAGTYEPPFGFEDDPAEMSRLEAAVTSTAPDIVFVGLGSPKQERLARRLRTLLPRTWWLGVGISFSFLTGDVPRAPPWMRRCGIEWVHRLAHEPRRLFVRYVVHGIPFGVRLMGWALWRRVRG